MMSGGGEGQVHPVCVTELLVLHYACTELELNMSTLSYLWGMRPFPRYSPAPEATSRYCVTPPESFDQGRVYDPTGTNHSGASSL